MGNKTRNSRTIHIIQTSLLLLSLFLPLLSRAQYPLSKPGLRDQNNSVAYQNPLDTLTTDSLLSDIEIKPDVRLINPQALFLHLPYVTPFVKDLGSMPKWDELDREPGFVQSLGQIGKPYQHYLYGLADQHMYDRAVWRNPITLRYNVYGRNSQRQVPYYDTKTPYVNADFAQASKEMQRIDATISRNIGPRWNVSLLYQGRQAQGAHLQFATNHTSLFASSYFKSKNERYHLFGNWTFNELSDDLNGGIVRSLEGDLLVDESAGVIRDNKESLSDDFQKEQANLISADANRKSISRQLQLDQYFHLVKPDESDSATFSQQLTLRALVRTENNNHNFEDLQINRSKLELHAIPVYPTLDSSSTQLQEIYKSRSYSFLSGISYSINRPFRFHLDGHVAFNRIELDQDTLQEVGLSQFDIQGNGELGFSWGKVNASLHQRVSNLYDPQNRIRLSGTLYPLRRNRAKTLPDSLATERVVEASHSPLVLSGELSRWGQNPSLFQSHYIAGIGNTYQASSSLDNQQFSRFKARISWNPAAKIRKGDTLLPAFYYAEIFTSRASDLIYFNTQMQVNQASDPLTWVGAQIGLRTHLFSKTYLESQWTWQKGTTQAEDDFSYYAEYLPQLWGKTSYYYENHTLSIAAILKVGVELTYFTQYQGFAPDIVSGSFFPTLYQISDYVVADVFFATQVKRAYIFFKLSHANEGLLQAGYYTTPFYPMLERTFSLGISWAFFD